MSQPFAIRCCTCQSIWEAESLSTLLQCPYCLAILELDTPVASAPSLDQQRSQELRWELARQMLLQGIARWRERLLTEQPQLIDLPLATQTPWWTDQRVVWRALAAAGVLTLSFLFGPWVLTLALATAFCYAIVIHPGWNLDERTGQLTALRKQILPLLKDTPRSEFTATSRYADTPFDAAAWLQGTWGNYSSGDVFQILGWQQEALLAAPATSSTLDEGKLQEQLGAYLHETKPVATDVP